MSKYKSIISLLIIIDSIIIINPNLINFIPEIDDNIVNNLINFFSIIMGFQSASFAILFNSRIISNLYQEIDENYKPLTKKHVVKNSFRNLFLGLLISIIILTFINMFKYDFLKKLLIINSIGINLYLMYFCNDYLYKVFMKENN